MPPAKSRTAPQSEEPQTSPAPETTSALEEESTPTAPVVDPIPTPADVAPTDQAPADVALPEPDTTEVVMKVKISGTRNGEEWPPVGNRASLPREEAVALIANGMATLPPTPAIETAVAFAATETATVTGKDSIKAQESAD